VTYLVLDEADRMLDMVSKKNCVVLQSTFWSSLRDSHQEKIHHVIDIGI
jgi:superfamily II DNA/RNA helicase